MGDLARGTISLSVEPGRVVDASWMVGRKHEEACPLRDGPSQALS
jgi:hypothetical protein